MKIFISWSGERARAVATELRSWIAMILQATKPWMSDRDLDSGVSWSAEIAKQLDGSSVGIICVTPERMSAPWLLFESGAIAKQLDDARVIPYLIDLSPAELTGPLSQFQARKANKEDTLRLLLDINKHLPEPRDEEEVKKMFGSFWSQLEKTIAAQVNEGNPRESEEPNRSSDAMIEELLLLARENSRELQALRGRGLQSNTGVHRSNTLLGIERLGAWSNGDWRVRPTNAGDFSTYTFISLKEPITSQVSSQFMYDVQQDLINRGYVSSIANIFQAITRCLEQGQEPDLANVVQSFIDL